MVKTYCNRIGVYLTLGSTSDPWHGSKFGWMHYADEQPPILVTELRLHRQKDGGCVEYKGTALMCIMGTSQFGIQKYSSNETAVSNIDGQITLLLNGICRIRITAMCQHTYITMYGQQCSYWCTSAV
jgi:hypothetical protein